MKLTTGILAITITMTAGAALTIPAAAQNSDAIDNARSTVKAIEQENSGSAGSDATSTKPAPGAPAPAVKPAVVPGAAPAALTTPSAAAKTVAPAPASARHNQLKKVNVIATGDSFRIEMVSSDAVAGKASALKSPDRVLVELPGTIAATRENRIEVGNSEIKGIRIGTDGKNPPTTSVVVDLQKACAYELTPGPSGTLVLTVHTDAMAKNAAPPAAKAPASAPKQVQTVAKNTVAQAPKQVQTVAKSTPVASPKQVQIVAKNNPAPAPKPVPVPKATKAAAKAVVAAKIVVANSAAAKATAKQPEKLKAEATTSQPDAAADLLPPKPEEKKPEEKKWAMTGKRDPFFSPVVQQGGSGCSTGKKCLEIGTINLRGVVKSDSGFIAVVTNNLNKAYFLRENDPVFNGYVVKITGDSVVFQETVEDKLGKQFTREVVKRIFTPAV
jgi:Tfp pilus assembly protein PilP